MLGRRGALGLATLLAACVGASAAQAVLLDFEDVGFVHGTVIDDQFESSLGVSISAVNNSTGPDLAVIFNSRLTGTRDPDLEGPPNGLWDSGNLSGDTLIGNLLIVQENDVGCDDGGMNDVCDRPDDEGSRVSGGSRLENGAGYIQFAFGPGREITEFGFDLVDIEGPEEMGEVIFYNGGIGGTELGAFDFEDFMARDGAVYGDNSANRIAPIDLMDEFGELSADTVVVRFGGSGALDNVRFEVVPEPATAQLVGLALLGMAWRRRRSFPDLRAR